MPRLFRFEPSAAIVRRLRATGLLAAVVVVLICGGGCGEPPSQPADLSHCMMIFADARVPGQTVTLVVSDIRAVLIVASAKDANGKEVERTFYATERLPAPMFHEMRQLSGYAPDADAPFSSNPPPGFYRWIYTVAPQGRLQPPPEEAGFTPTHYSQYPFDKVRKSLEDPTLAVKALPNWVFANESMARQLGVK